MRYARPPRSPEKRVSGAQDLLRQARDAAADYLTPALPRRSCAEARQRSSFLSRCPPPITAATFRRQPAAADFTFRRPPPLLLYGSAMLSACL